MYNINNSNTPVSPDFVNTIGINIRIIRRYFHFTQEQFSTYLLIDQTLISKYELSERIPPLEFIIHLSNFSKVSLDILILGSPTKLKAELKNIYE